MIKPVVATFVHKEAPNWFELISLKQLVDTLPSYDFFIFASRGIDVSAYTDIAPMARVVYDNVGYLTSLSGYNRLKISKELYFFLERYSHLLTYELDSFVFRDELLYWCEKDFDYIGAPWFEGFHLARECAPFVGVGNSGFSLRRIDKCLKVLCSENFLEKSLLVVNRLFRKKNQLRRIFIPTQISSPSPSDNFQGNEDVFWSSFVPTLFGDFRIAGQLDATRFSFELNAPELYKTMQDELPFGCHKWMHYTPEFWRPHVEKFGHCCLIRNNADSVFPS